MKFVYFDLGGVLVKDMSKTDKWDEMVESWKIDVGRVEELNQEFDDFEKEACVGRNIDDFVPILREKYGAKIESNYSLLEAIVATFERNEGIWEIVEKVKKSDKVGLLTNMYPGMRKMIEQRNLIREVDWEVVVDSAEVGMRKPDRDIYLLAEKRAGGKGEEILFVENTKNNLIWPEKLGWKVFWYDPADYEKSNRELADILSA